MILVCLLAVLTSHLMCFWRRLTVLSCFLLYSDESKNISIPCLTYFTVGTIKVEQYNLLNIFTFSSVKIGGHL